MESVTPLLGTLEETGRLYNPFSTSDVWGAPSNNSFAPNTRPELPVGHDSSALPSLAQPSMTRDYKFGSGVAYIPPAKPDVNMMYLAIFAGVIVLAMYWKP